MSSIQSVQGAGAAALATAQTVPKTQAGKAESAAHEAQETVAVTKAEARKGDPQAIRKMERVQSASEPQKAEPVATPPVGTGGKINVTA